MKIQNSIHTTKTKLNLLAAGLFLAATTSAWAGTVRYVDVNSASPTPPFLTWATAAMNIQDAVDAAVAGDELVVTNGTYASGGRAGSRVAVDKTLLTLRSVNGPDVTVINGSGAVRCVYLTNDTVLVGFTLTNGMVPNGMVFGYGGGVYCESASVVLSNCVLSGNSAGYGGGADGGTLNNCTLSGNSATSGGEGGGAYESTLNNCTVVSNSATSGCGGGAFVCTLNNCSLTGNSARQGGGACVCTLNNCTLTGNSAGYGGGVYGATLNNCTLTGNSAIGDGGGAFGGTYPCTLNNCIVYFNSAFLGANYDSSSALNYCCTTPQPTGGTNNFSLDPQLASASHLSASSPCRGAGSAGYATGTDIDGEAWGSPPSVGCDEYHVGAVTGLLSVAISPAYTNVAVGCPVGLAALIEGRTTMSIWDFGDGIVVSNQPYASHAWAAPGDYVVVLWAYNESLPAGVSGMVTIHVVAQPVYYVAADSTSPSPPYGSWATAATNIQDAVDAAIPGGDIVVTNGVYGTGGRAVSGTMTNRVVVDKPTALRSANGPQFTVIQGYQVPGTTNGDAAIRCVYLTKGASLCGFTLTNGATRYGESGGGLWCESASAVVSNCVVVGNSAAGGGVGEPAGVGGGGAAGGTLNNCTFTGNWAGNGGGAYGCTLNYCSLTGNSASQGGGAYGCTLNDCTLTGNSAYATYGAWWMHGGIGGGAYGSALNNCTLTGNWASDAWNYLGNVDPGAGGGAYGGTLNNCILYYNTASSGANYSGSTLNYCCTKPKPPGAGNISLAPQFVNQTGGNLRLQSNSPCINAGTNAYVVGSTDLDGRPRIVGGRVDMGAYEFQPGVSGLFIGWLQQYGLPTGGSADYLDSDGDGLNNWQEWRCGTCPTNALSVLQMLSVTNALSGVTVSWQSVAGVNYLLECSTNLSASPCFTCVATNLPGQPGTTTYTDTNAVGAGPFFYRVGVSSQ